MDKQIEIMKQSTDLLQTMEQALTYVHNKLKVESLDSSPLFVKKHKKGKHF